MRRGRDPHQKYPLLPPPLNRFDEEVDVDHSENLESESPQSEDLPNPAPWNELPNEMLRTIFEQLQSLECRPYFNGNLCELWKNSPCIHWRQSLLKCRGVHPRWKAGMDSLLEQACLEGWTKWKPWCSSSPFLNSGVIYGFPILKAAASSKGFKLNSSLFPSSILNKTHQGNPFPTKSTILKFITSHRFHYERNVLMKVEEFFSNWGNHLTSLTLWSFTTQAKIRPKGLQIILQNTPNLKALTLNGMSIDLTRSKSLFENEEARLPPLSKLEHVLITDVYSEGNDPVAEEHNLCNWGLDPYKQQLVGLETDSHFGGGGHESPSNYASLKQLKMWMPKAAVLKAPLSCPQLERLSLREVEEPVVVHGVKQFISHFSQTLVHLYIDIIRKGQRSILTHLTDVDENNDEIPSVELTSLKTLSILYPMHPEEVLELKKFLKLFPNLETLDLLRFRGFPGDFYVLGQSTNKRLKEHLENERYSDVCKKLTTINIRWNLEADIIYYTHRI